MQPDEWESRVGHPLEDSTQSPYLSWNDALAARFFCPEVAGQPVYLFVTDDTLREIGQALGGGKSEFLAAVRAGPVGVTRAGHCQRALQVADRWRERGLRYPPYIAYLSLFVLAGGHEGEFDPRSYYPRLWELLGEAEQGTPPSFDRMLELWDDLEKWSVHDMGGALGLFEERIVGGKIHIGLPLAQTMLTEDERRALPRIFASAGLQPGSLPSDREIRRALTVHGRSSLHRRTLSALAHDSASFIAALLDVVSDEFLSWDGEIPEERAERGGKREVSAGLRLCLSLDRVSRTVRPSLRCRSKSEFPEAGLLLSGSPMVESLTCGEFVPGWSSPLASAAAGADFGPSGGVWDEGLVLTDTSAGWTLRLQRSSIRVFVDGRREQLPGLVETLDVPRSRSFYIAFRETLEPALEHWVGSGCRGWQRIEVTTGLPSGWLLASIEEAITDDGPRAIDDRLGFPDRRTLRFTGGIPAAVRSTFFSFAPPHVVLEGAQAGDSVVCNGSPLHEEEAAPGLYSLPQGLPVDTRVGIEACHADEVIKRRSLYLVSGAPWQFTTPLATLDGYGRRLSDGDEGIAGAAVPAADRPDLPADLLRTPGLGAGATRVFFLGRIPGRVAVWPREPLPDWQPVWAVPLHRRGRALFCGDSLDEAEPKVGQVGECDRITLWCTVFFRWGERITPPREPALRSLWNLYRKAARVA